MEKSAQLFSSRLFSFKLSLYHSNSLFINFGNYLFQFWQTLGKMVHRFKRALTR